MKSKKYFLDHYFQLRSIEDEEQFFRMSLIELLVDIRDRLNDLVETGDDRVGRRTL